MERPERQPDREVVGIVLAGGNATRLGAAGTAGKAWLELDGKTFLERVCAAVAPEVAAIAVVAAVGQDLPRVPGVMVVRDAVPGEGPLAAIRDGIRALVAAGGARPPRRFVVVSCDVPRVRREVIRSLLDAASAPAFRDVVWTVPVVHGHPQVLLSVLDVRLLPRLEAWLAAGRRDPRGLVTSLLAKEASAVRLLDETLLAAADPTLASFMDIDTPDDLRRLESR